MGAAGPLRGCPQREWESERQWLALKPDPRVKATASDYAREFELAREIEAARVRCARRSDAKTLHEALLKRPERAPLDAQLMAVADLPSEDPRNSVPVSAHSPDTLQGLSEDLDKLANAVDGADGGPTPDARVRPSNKLRCSMPRSGAGTLSKRR